MIYVAFEKPESAVVETGVEKPILTLRCFLQVALVAVVGLWWTMWRLIVYL